MTGERFIPKRMQALAEIEHYHRYYSVKNILHGKIVLDAACGTGYGSSIISETADMVYGIDISDEAILYAEEHYSNSKIKYTKGSIEKLEFPDKYFDVVVSFETIEHVDEKSQKVFLDEICRVLKSDGILIMSTPDKKNYTDLQSGNQTEWHIKEFYAKEFEEFILSKFQYIKWYNQYMSETSQIVDNTDEQLNKINYNKELEGKFIIVIASNQPIVEGQYSISSSYYCSKDYTELDDFIQVYYSKDDEDFSETRYQLKELSRSSKYIEEKIWLDGEKGSKIRIDPLSTSCKLTIKYIHIILTNGEIINCRNFITNANDSVNGKYTFYHSDPQLIINLEKEQLIDYVEIKYIIDDFDLDIYPLYNLLKQKYEMLNVTYHKEIGEYRDQLLFEKGKNCTLNELCDKKEVLINELKDRLRIL